MCSHSNRISTRASLLLKEPVWVDLIPKPPSCPIPGASKQSPVLRNRVLFSVEAGISRASSMFDASKLYTSREGDPLLILDVYDLDYISVASGV